MTVRVFPLPLENNHLHLKVDTDVRAISVSSLRRTDEFKIDADWWDSINYPLVINVSKVSNYLDALNAQGDIFFEFSVIAEKSLGILIQHVKEGVILVQYCGRVVGTSLFLTPDELFQHVAQIGQMMAFLNQASNNVDYEAVTA